MGVFKLFKNNKYTKWYQEIVYKARQKIYDDYTELHHIIPISLGGDDSVDNVVKISAKEHFILHHLLTKMVYEKDLSKMWNAFFLMHFHNSNKRYSTPRTYELSKMHMALIKKELIGDKNPFYGKQHSKETKQKMSASWNKNAQRNVDNKKYNFYHKEYGYHFLTQKELYTQFNLNNKGVSMLIRQKAPSYKGWIIKNAE